MTHILHKADSRGLADHGWLVSRHTFSFANYHNPARMHFGMLRVINDDIVQPAMGFGTHPHENMEIVSIPLSGALRHQDSMGNKHMITAGEVQIMSAGSGLTHSEYNNSDQEEVNFLQIWVFPEVKNITPRYGQKRFDKANRHNRFQTLVSPQKEGDAIWINQQAWFSMTNLDAGTSLSYLKQRTGNGLYFFIIEGSVEIEGTKLDRRDALGLTTDGDEGQVQVKALSQAEILCIDVPLH
ncbi:pirin family protein [Geopsychrobacter electrodiphilus]|uniref:pirin family protein n=1 Tax=Geopsychrobacter electrodiphilus TaxID=225196 RepID=UPI00036CA616|nr:pirin family protein [Geopsychrobacter electrodiphilus]